MSHNIHEPNHAGDCIFCGKHVGKSYKMASSAQANPTDTNQASEDEQIDDVLTNAIDYYISGNGVQPEAISRVKSLIRTEKLKLLAEVRERVVGAKNDLCFTNKMPQTLPEYVDDVVKVREQLRVEQREVLTKLEAEL